jgi:hypothetical protein
VQINSHTNVEKYRRGHRRSAQIRTVLPKEVEKSKSDATRGANKHKDPKIAALTLPYSSIPSVPITNGKPGGAARGRNPAPITSKPHLARGRTRLGVTRRKPPHASRNPDGEPGDGASEREGESGTEYLKKSRSTSQRYRQGRKWEEEKRGGDDAINGGH